MNDPLPQRSRPRHLREGSTHKVLPDKKRHERSHSAGHTAPTRAWQDAEKWARADSPDRSFTRLLSALREPRLFIGILTAILLVGSGLHMAASITPGKTQLEAIDSSSANPGLSGADLNRADSAVASPTALPQAQAANSSAATGSAAGAGSATEIAQKSPHAASSQNTLLVHVVGAVKEPGVVTLPQGTRVHDAVQKAGGLMEDADVRGVNLARVLSDGEQIYIPAESETPPATSPTSAAADPAPQLAASGDSQMVNVNQASAAELETLPGIGPSLAARIIEYRQVNGPFTSPEQLQEVSGIGPSTFEKFRDRIAI